MLDAFDDDGTTTTAPATTAAPPPAVDAFDAPAPEADEGRKSYAKAAAGYASRQLFNRNFPKLAQAIDADAAGAQEGVDYSDPEYQRYQSYLAKHPTVKPEEWAGRQQSKVDPATGMFVGDVHQSVVPRHPDADVEDERRGGYAAQRLGQQAALSQWQQHANDFLRGKGDYSQWSAARNARGEQLMAEFAATPQGQALAGNPQQLGIEARSYAQARLDALGYGGGGGPIQSQQFPEQFNASAGAGVLGRAGDLGYATARGAIGGVESILAGGASVLGGASEGMGAHALSHWFQDKSQLMRDVTSDVLPPTGKEMQPGMSAEKIAGYAGGALPHLGAALATGGASVMPLAGVQGAGDAYDYVYRQMREKGANHHDAAVVANYASLLGGGASAVLAKVGPLGKIGEGAAAKSVLGSAARGAAENVLVGQAAAQVDPVTGELVGARQADVDEMAERARSAVVPSAVQGAVFGAGQRLAPHPQQPPPTQQPGGGRLAGGPERPAFMLEQQQQPPTPPPAGGGTKAPPPGPQLPGNFDRMTYKDLKTWGDGNGFDTSAANAKELRSSLRAQAQADRGAEHFEEFPLDASDREAQTNNFIPAIKDTRTGKVYAGGTTHGDVPMPDATAKEFADHVDRTTEVPDWADMGFVRNGKYYTREEATDFVHSQKAAPQKAQQPPQEQAPEPPPVRPPQNTAKPQPAPAAKPEPPRPAPAAAAPNQSAGRSIDDLLATENISPQDFLWLVKAKDSFGDPRTGRIDADRLQKAIAAGRFPPRPAPTPTPPKGTTRGNPKDENRAPGAQPQGQGTDRGQPLDRGRGAAEQTVPGEINVGRGGVGIGEATEPGGRGRADAGRRGAGHGEPVAAAGGAEGEGADQTLGGQEGKGPDRLPQTRDQEEAGRAATVEQRSRLRRLTGDETADLRRPATPEQREAADVARGLGLELRFYSAREAKGSFVDPSEPAAAYVPASLRGAAAVREAVGHELTHALARTNPEALRDVLDRVDPDTLSKSSAAYLRKYQAKMGTPAALELMRDPGRMAEEGVASILGEAATRSEVWRRMKGDEPSPVDVLRDAMRAIADRVRGKSAMVEAAARAFEKARKPEFAEKPLKAEKENRGKPVENERPAEGVGPAADRAAPPAHPEPQGQGVAADENAAGRGGTGRRTVIDTATEKVPARYAVMDAGDVRPSHNAFTFQPNPKHAGGQERNYTRDRNEQQKVIEHAERFDSRHVLSDDPTPANGPPMVLRDGSAVGGNSRAMTMQRVYAEPKSAAKLKADVVAAAERFGIDPAAAKAVKRPVIVRVLDENVKAGDAGRLGELSRTLQKGLTQEMSSGQDAASRSRILAKDPENLERISQLLSSEDASVRDVLSNPSKSEKLAQLLVDSGAIHKTELSKFVKPKEAIDRTGFGFTEEGKRLVEQMLLSTAVKDPTALDGLPQTIVNKLTGNLAELGYVETKGGEWSIGEDVTRALEAYQRFRARAGAGVSLADWLSGREQMQLVPDEITGEGRERAREILKALASDKAAEFKARLRQFANDARGGDPNQIAMFAGAIRTPAEAFDAAFGGEAPTDKALYLPAWAGSLGRRALDALVGPKSAIRDFAIEPVGRIAAGLHQLGRYLKNTFGLQGGAMALEAKGVLRNNAAEADLHYRQLEAVTAAAHDYFAGRPSVENLDFMQRADTGAKQASKQLQATSDFFQGVWDHMAKRLDAVGVDTSTFRDYYFPHLWKNVKQARRVMAELFGKPGSFEGSKSFLKERVYDTVLAGLKAGLEPVSDNPVDLVLHKFAEVSKLLAARQSMSELATKGMLRFVQARDRMPDGWEKLNDNAFTIYGRGQPHGVSKGLPDLADYAGGPDSGTKVRERGGLTHAASKVSQVDGYLVAPADVASVVNNMVTPSALRGAGLFRFLRDVNNRMTQAQLGLSGFHVAKVGKEVVNLSVARSLDLALHGEFGKSAAAAGLAGLSPAQVLAKGHDVEQLMLNPLGRTPEELAIRDALVAGGHRVKADNDYTTSVAQKMREAWRDGGANGLTRAGLRVPFAATEKITNFIMGGVQRAKLGMAFYHVRDALARLGPGASIDAIRQESAKISDHLDNVMGLMVKDNLFWNRTASDIAHLMTLSVGWNYGSLRALVGGLKDLAAAPFKLVKGQKVDGRRISYLASTAGLQALGGALVTYLATGKGPQSLMDYLYPPSGKEDRRGRPIRLNLGLYTNDYYGFLTAPTETAVNKASPLVHFALSALARNQDYRGIQVHQPVRSWADVPKASLDVMEYFGKQFIPISVRGQMELGGGKAGKLGVLPYAGITPARASTSMSSAEQYAAELRGERRPAGGRTPEQADRTDLRYELASKLRAKDPGAQQAITDALRAGKIKPADRKAIADLSKMSPIVSATHGMPFEQQMDVFEKASDDEKREMMPQLLRGFFAAKLPLADKAEYRKQLLSERDRLRPSR